MTCPWEEGSLETRLWEATNGWIEPGAFKAWFTQHFNLERDDWISGWGWDHLEDHRRPFAKMYTAAVMLAYGLDDAQIRGWRAHWTTALTVAATVDPVVSFDGDGVLLAFWRNDAGELIHARTRPAALQYLPAVGGYPPEFEYELNVSASIAVPGPGGATFTGAVFSLGEGGHQPLRVLGLPGDAPGRVVLFTQKPKDSGGGWRCETLTPQGAPSLLLRNPVVIPYPDGSFQLWGSNAKGELVEYWWTPASGLASVAVLPFSAVDWAVSGAQGALVALRGASGLNHLFAVRAPSASSSEPYVEGDLLHFWQTAPGEPWKAENVTRMCPHSERFAARTNLIVWEIAGGIRVFGLAKDGALLWAEYRVPGCIAIILGSRPAWSIVNLTNDAAPDARGQRWHLDSNVVSTRPDQVLGAGSGLLISFHQSPSGWVQDNLTYAADIPRVGKRLYAGPYSETMDEVFSVSPNGHLVRFVKDPSSAWWLWHDLHHEAVDPGLGATAGWKESGRLALARMGGGASYALAPAVPPGNPPRPVLFCPDYGHVWHSNWDYRRWARGKGSFADFKYVPEESQDGAAYASWNIAADDVVNMRCPSFEMGPGERAGVMVHEATHEITHDTHVDVDGVDKDPWKHHGLNDIALDDLTPDTQPHSCFQMEVEYLSDVFEYPAAWVPHSVRTETESRARYLLEHHFTNDPGWVVGLPRPL
jgi:hypothetical protein